MLSNIRYAVNGQTLKCTCKSECNKLCNQLPQPQIDFGRK